MSNEYSVLMSVYYKESAFCLREAIEGVWDQSIKPTDFVLICDGPLTSELDYTIKDMQERYGSSFNVIRLDENRGLGESLNLGLKYCKNSLIMRMDSDDICLKDRAEKQLAIFEKHPQLSVVSGQILEFMTERDNVVSCRSVPEFQKDIIAFSKTRNPFNHPAVMFRKEAIISVGGYNERFNLFEDYYLWIRLLKEGYEAYNIQEPLLKMRVSLDMYSRRGGLKYAKELLRFKFWLKEVNWIGWKEILFNVIPHAIVCILPNYLRRLVYSILRKE